MEFSHEHAVPHKDKLVDESWCAKLAYLADIFVYLNKFNAKLQGRNENILLSSRFGGSWASLPCGTRLWSRAPWTSAAPQVAREM